MKTKEIITKLQIQNGVNGKKEKELFQILIEELKELYAGFKVKDSDRHFDAAVKDLRSKWNSISLKIRGGLSDKAWNYFYATAIIDLKKTLCPTWVAKKEIEHEKYLKRQERRRQMEEEREERQREREERIKRVNRIAAICFLADEL